MPDAGGLELLADALRGRDPDCVLQTGHVRGKASIDIEPGTINDVLAALRGDGFDFLASVHGLDYYQIGRASCRESRL